MISNIISKMTKATLRGCGRLCDVVLVLSFELQFIYIWKPLESNSVCVMDICVLRKVVLMVYIIITSSFFIITIIIL